MPRNGTPLRWTEPQAPGTQTRMKKRCKTFWKRSGAMPPTVLRWMLIGEKALQNPESRYSCAPILDAPRMLRLEWHLLFLIGGITKLLHTWGINGMKEDPKTLACLASKNMCGMFWSSFSQYLIRRYDWLHVGVYSNAHLWSAKSHCPCYRRTQPATAHRYQWLPNQQVCNTTGNALSQP